MIMQYDLQKKQDLKQVINERVRVEPGELLESAVFIPVYNEITKISPPSSDLEFFDLKLIALGFSKP